MGGFASLVKYVNQSPCQVVSIDLPSGLMCEDNTYNVNANIIRANLTLTIQQKKLSMLFADCQQFIGRLKVIDIRLSPEYIMQTEAKCRILEENDVAPLLRRRSDFANKGTMGHSLIVAGSFGMSGAAVLATKACLRSGVGKVTVHTPARNYDIMQISVPEAVLQLDKDDYEFSESVACDDFDSLGIGPGLGLSESTAVALIGQISRAKCPVVADATPSTSWRATRRGYSSCPRTSSSRRILRSLTASWEARARALTTGSCVPGRWRRAFMDTSS